MKKSALQVARAAYQPKLPKSLKGTYQRGSTDAICCQSGRDCRPFPEYLRNASLDI